MWFSVPYCGCLLPYDLTYVLPDESVPEQWLSQFDAVPGERSSFVMVLERWSFVMVLECWLMPGTENARHCCYCWNSPCDVRCLNAALPMSLRNPQRAPVAVFWSPQKYSCCVVGNSLWVVVSMYSPLHSSSPAHVDRSHQRLNVRI